MSATTGQLLLLLVPLFPLLLALLLLTAQGEGKALLLLPLGAVPGLAASLLVPFGTAVDLSWLLLGGRLAQAGEGRIFLLFSALLWLLAGLYAAGYLAEDPRRRRFFSLFLVTMAGNLGVLIAQDLLLFYLFFALMSFAAYVLVIHDGSAAALRAGRIYLGMVVVGELCIFAGLLLAAAAAETLQVAETAAALASAPGRGTIMLLLIAGFGIKAGLVPLHLWLPLAHPVAPTPASAVLSGAMIKTGLFAWLRLLPMGDLPLHGWAEAVLAGGLLTVFFGVVVGVLQTEAKTVLAYSSISQMGFLIVGVGIGLEAPQAWPAVVGGICLYAVHHGLAKGALFLGVGIVPLAGRRGRGLLVSLALALPALALAGAPYTSGALAKIALKPHLGLAPSFWPQWLALLLSVAAVGTTLLMGRFFWLLAKQGGSGHRPARTMVVSWGGLVAASLLLPWIIVANSGDIEKALAPEQFWSALWPVGLGVLLLTGGVVLLRCRGGSPLQIPPGDLLLLLEGLWGLRTLLAGRFPSLRIPRRAPAPSFTFLEDAERRLLAWPAAGLLFLLLLLLLTVLLAFF